MLVPAKHTLFGVAAVAAKQLVAAVTTHNFCHTVFQRHLGKGPVAQDAGIVDEDVDAPPRVEGLCRHLLHLIRLRDVTEVHERFASQRTNLGHDGLRSGAMVGTIQVIDDNARTLAGQFQRMRTAEAPARAGDDGDAILKKKFFQSGCGWVGQKLTALAPLSASMVRTSAGDATSRDSSSRMRRILRTCSAQLVASWPLPR